MVWNVGAVVWVRGWYLGAVKVLGGGAVWGKDDDIIPCVAQAFDQALEAIFHAANVRKWRGLDKDGHLALLFLLLLCGHLMLSMLQTAHTRVMCTSRGQHTVLQYIAAMGIHLGECARLCTLVIPSATGF